MVEKILSKVDSKTITSAGGIVLAGILAYGLISILKGEIANGQEDVRALFKNQAKIQQETNSIISKLIIVIDRNTFILDQKLK